MKKKFYCIVFLIFLSTRVYSQAAVSVINDSPLTMGYYFDSILKTVSMISNTAKTIDLQIKAFEKLGEGGFEGFKEYLKYQNRAISSFTNTFGALDFSQIFDSVNFDVNFNTDWLKDFNDIKLPIEEMAQGVEEMLDIFNDMAAVATDTSAFVNNTKQRVSVLQDLLQKSKSADSPVAQSEILMQTLSLIAAQNEDSIQLGKNLANIDGNERSYVNKVGKYLGKVAKEEFEKQTKIGSANPLVNYESDVKFYKNQIDSLWEDVSTLGTENTKKNKKRKSSDEEIEEEDTK